MLDKMPLKLSETNTADIILTGSTYLRGPLGKYYLPSTSSLINAGTPTANLVGLYHYTTQTNQLKEGTSTNDISFHYVALDTNGAPMDTDGGGVPDFIENAAGDGSTNNVGESNWQNGTDDYTHLLTPAYLRCEYLQNPLSRG